MSPENNEIRQLNLSAEREKVYREINWKKIEGHEVQVGESGNIIVLYNGSFRDVHKHWGSWLETDPVALAQYLDINTQKTLSYHPTGDVASHALLLSCYI